MFGEEVGFVELEPWFVLPKSLRTRELAWDREFLFGRYTVKAKINRGYDNVIDEVSTTFWVLPWKIMLGTFATLFFIIFVIRAFFRNFEFKRK
jgi:ABC-type multidrug transport system permease subunit